MMAAEDEALTTAVTKARTKWDELRAEYDTPEVRLAGAEVADQLATDDLTGPEQRAVTASFHLDKTTPGWLERAKARRS